MGSGCTRIISWLCVRMGFGHPLPTESFKVLYTPSSHWQEKDMKDKGMTGSRLGIPVRAEQWQPPPVPSPAKIP